jgi:Asp/Glu/hydantoin racemase
VRKILVINPNSNATVTRGLGDALQGWRAHADLQIECSTLAEGPFGIESAEDIAAVEPLLLQEVQRREDCSAFVIACYSDPGLASCREAVARPVFGMQQSAVATALAYGGRFGVLALSQASIERHLRYLEALGVQGLLAAERALDLSVDQAAKDPRALQRIIEEGRRLIDDCHAATLILGCAGLARHRRAAEQVLQVPVIDPVQAAVALAAGALSDT